MFEIQNGAQDRVLSVVVETVLSAAMLAAIAKLGRKGSLLTGMQWGMIGGGALAALELCKRVYFDTNRFSQDIMHTEGKEILKRAGVKAILVAGVIGLGMVTNQPGHYATLATGLCTVTILSGRWAAHLDDSVRIDGDLYRRAF